MTSDTMRLIVEEDIPQNVLVLLEVRGSMVPIRERVTISEVGEKFELSTTVTYWNLEGRRKDVLLARRLASFWKSAERLGCWELTDRSDRATDLDFIEIYLRRGEKRRFIRCYGLISPSPQRKLMALIRRIGGVEALLSEVR